MKQNNQDILEEYRIKSRVLRQLEGVYRTTSSVVQKKRVHKEIENLKRIVERLRQKLPYDESEFEIEWEENWVRILNKIEVKKHKPYSKDREIDEITSYMSFFENNYLPLLSEYYIKLDFSHSQKRDIFYPGFMEIKKVLKEYDYEIEVHSREEYNTIAFFKSKSNIYRIKHRYLMALNTYFRELKGFLDVLVDDHRTGGSVVLNPYGEILLSDSEENRRLQGSSVIEALSEMRIFCEEVIRYLGMPER
ncbi:MAG: hypothetical protein ACOC7U_00330 [Spirochaetota bacterium]